MTKNTIITTSGAALAGALLVLAARPEAGPVQDYARALCLVGQADIGRTESEAEALCSRPDPRLVRHVERSVREVSLTPTNAAEEAENLRRKARLLAEQARSEAFDEATRAAKTALTACLAREIKVDTEDRRKCLTTFTRDGLGDSDAARTCAAEACAKDATNLPPALDLAPHVPNPGPEPSLPTHAPEAP